MQKPPTEPWRLEDFGGDDDLFGLDAQALFRPDQALVESIDSPSTVFTSTDSDVFEPLFAVDQELGLLDSGYISSNSSDSGKFSPTDSSESTCEHGWTFPETKTLQKEPTKFTYERWSNEQMYLPVTPQPIQPQGFYAETISPPPAATPIQATTPSKLIYVVPSASITPAPRVPLAAVPYSGGHHTIFLKTDPVATTTPIFISQTTGNQLQPISLVSPQQHIALVGRDPEEEEMLRRLEDRKAKNRASAQASRNKRKNELDEAKRTIALLREENARLAAENNALKLRLTRYEVVAEDGGPSRKRVALAGGLVMALFMMVTVTPFRMDATAPAALPVAIARKPTAFGRVLSADTVLPSPVVTNGSSCANKKYFNSTEAIRLNNDLYEWVDRHQTMELGLKGGKRMLLQKKQRDWVSSVGKLRVNVTEEQADSNSDQKAPAAKKAHSGDRLWKHLDMISVGGASARERRDRVRKLLKGGGKTTYDSRSYEKLSSAIQQKEDTLYVVALEDYFLMPALARNFTSQPRLTLILPAMSYNSTVAGKVPLMRIDLRVVGTGLFNLSRQLLPLFLN